MTAGPPWWGQAGLASFCPTDWDLKCTTIIITSIISQLSMLFREAHIFIENITTDLCVQEKQTKNYVIVLWMCRHRHTHVCTVDPATSTAFLSHSRARAEESGVRVSRNGEIFEFTGCVKHIYVINGCYTGRYMPETELNDRCQNRPECLQASLSLQDSILLGGSTKNSLCILSSSE